jgi:hypothetical protein
MVNSKQKGASFERAICKQLSRWLSNGTHDDLLWRSAMSGGRSTVAFKATGKKLSAQAGDVSSIHRLSHQFIDTFLIEAKSYRTLNFESLIKGKGNLITFWQATCREARRHNKLPMLVGKQNNYPVIVCLCKNGIKMFCPPKVIVADYDLNIILFEDFLKISPRLVKRIRL